MNNSSILSAGFSMVFIDKDTLGKKVSSSETNIW